MKTLGYISKRQLHRFRKLFGATEDGETFPLVDNFRPIQSIDKRVVYECGTNGFVEYRDDKSSSDESDSDDNNNDSSGGSDSADSMEIVEDLTESANVKYIIASIGGLVSLGCIALISGGWHYRRKVTYSKRKLSDHIQLETAVVSEPDSDDGAEGTDGDKSNESIEVHKTLIEGVDHGNANESTLVQETLKWWCK